MASTAVGPPVQPSARPSTLVTTAIPATSTGKPSSSLTSAHNSMPDIEILTVISGTSGVEIVVSTIPQSIVTTPKLIILPLGTADVVITAATTPGAQPVIPIPVPYPVTDLESAVASAQSSSTPTTIEPTPIQSDMPPTDTSIPTSGPFSNVFAYAVGISCVVLVIITFAIMWFLNRRARATGPATSETGHVEKDDMTDIETAA